MDSLFSQEIKAWMRVTLFLIGLSFFVFWSILFYESFQNKTFDLNDDLHAYGDRYFSNFERPFIEKTFVFLKWINPFLGENEENKLQTNLIKIDKVSFREGFGVVDSVEITLISCENRTDISSSECD